MIIICIFARRNSYMFMHFQNPEMLWCLFALLIPIAIHLFNLRRYKLTYFSNTEVLRQIEQQTAKTQKLKHRIVLALRCLFIAALVLAFAKPCKNSPEKDILNDNASLTAFYIDNTMSMKSMAKKTTLLADAREAATALVEKMGHSNRFVLITNSFELQNEYPMNRDEMLDHINKMHTEGRPSNLATIMSRVDMIAQQNGFDASNVFLFSDFQENMLAFDDYRSRTVQNAVALPLVSSNTSNVYIDTLWLDSPIVQRNMSNTLHVKIFNDSDADASSLPVSLFVDDELVATASADIARHDEAELVMQFMLETSGTHRCRVEMADYPITFDNDYKFVLESKDGMGVVEFGDAKSRVAVVFADDEQFSYTFVDMSHLDYEAMRDAQAVVLNTASVITSTLRQALIDGLNEGKSLVVFPSEKKSNLDELLSFCGLQLTDSDTASMAVESVAQNSEFFADVLLNVPQYADLPKVKRYSVIRPDAQTTVLMTLQNGLPFLVAKPVGKGTLFLFATSPDENSSDMSDNSLFVPLLVKMTLKGGAVGEIAHTIGQDGMVKIPSGSRSDELLHLSCGENGFESLITPVERNGQRYVTVSDMILAPGYYDITCGDKVLATTAWNENRSESVMRFANTAQINELLGKSGIEKHSVNDNADNTDKIIDSLSNRRGYWTLLLIVALLALVAESLVLRLWK